MQQKILRRAMLIWLPTTMVIVVLLGVNFQTGMGARLTEIQAVEENRVELIARILNEDFDSVVADLNLLARDTDLNALLSDEEDAEEHLRSFMQRIITVSNESGIYDQIRYLDETGQEVIRVNYNNGSPTPVRREDLQNKGDRYYFTDAFELERGEIFVSPLDLNVENGAVEQPLKPMIRFGTPVFDLAGEKRGIVLVNYFGAEMLSHLEWLEGETDISTPLLLNSDGYWLRGAIANEEWGFMFPEREDISFGASYPDVWTELDQTSTGQIRSGDLFTFTTIFPLQAVGQADRGLSIFGSTRDTSQYYWKIVTQVPEAALSPFAIGNLRAYLFAGVAFVVGAAVGAYLLATQTIQRQLAEEEVRRQRDQLEVTVAERTAELRTANADLMIANEEMRNFTSIVSHDLRSPVASMNGYMDELKKDWAMVAPQLEALPAGVNSGGSADIQPIVKQFIPESLDMISMSVNKMDRLTRSILTLSREQRREMELEPIDTQKLLEQLVDERRNEIVASGAAIHLPSDLPTIQGDVLAVEQVFGNVLSNALKYTVKGRLPVVDVSWKETDTHMRFSIADNGRGIAPQDQERVFQLFRRAGKQDVEGEGIGMYYVRQLVQKHGGDITFESQLNSGTTFHMTFAK